MFPKSEISTKHRRIQGNADQCFCDVASVAYSAPTEHAFLEAYNDDVSDLAQLGPYSHYIVTKVNEEDDDDADDTVNDDSDEESDDDVWEP